jgi:hypothetical protein
MREKVGCLQAEKVALPGTCDRCGIWADETSNCTYDVLHIGLAIFEDVRNRPDVIF